MRALARPQLGLAQYRLLARLSVLLALGATVFGLYMALHGQWGLALLGIGAGILLLYPSQYVGIRASPGSENQLVFVTKEACSLCDEARALLPSLTAQTPFTVSERLVESERFLRKAFSSKVPVLLWQGEVLAELRWDPADVRQRLDAIIKDRAATP